MNILRQTLFYSGILSVLFLASCKKTPYPSTSVTTTQPINITSTSATLRGITNPVYSQTSVSFEYGTSTSYGQQVQAQPGEVNGNNSIHVSATLTNLSPSTVYHYRASASTSSNKFTGDDITFTTLPLPSSITINYTSNDISYTDVNPDKNLTASNTTTTFPIDLNGDGTPDLNLSIYDFYPMGAPNPANAVLKVNTLNNNTSVKVTSSYPDTLSNGGTINVSDNWASGSLILLNYNQGPPPGGSISYQGNWYNITDKFLGVKYGNQLGWIEMSAFVDHITVYGFALEK